MSEFRYRRGVLHAEDLRLDKLAEAVGTPAYVYSHAALATRYRAFAAAFAGLDATVCYSVKANSNQAIIATFARLGAGADVVSQGELLRALAAGVPPGKIVFAGVARPPMSSPPASKPASCSSTSNPRTSSACWPRSRRA